MSSVITAPKEDNKLRVEDRAAHDWYRFVLSFPAHLVRDYIPRFEVEPAGLVLDPFCGRFSPRLLEPPTAIHPIQPVSRLSLPAETRR